MKSQRKIVKNVGKGAQESRGSVERTPRGRRTMGKRVATLAILALLVCVPFLTVQADQLSGSDRTHSAPYGFMGKVLGQDGTTPVVGIEVVGIVRGPDGVEHERVVDTTDENGSYSIVFAYWKDGDRAIIATSQGNLSCQEYPLFKGVGGDLISLDLVLHDGPPTPPPWEHAEDKDEEGGVSPALLIVLSIVAFIIILFLLRPKEGEKKKEKAKDGYSKERKRSR